MNTNLSVYKVGSLVIVPTLARAEVGFLVAVEPIRSAPVSRVDGAARILLASREFGHPTR